MKPLRQFERYSIFHEQHKIFHEQHKLLRPRFFGVRLALTMNDAGYWEFEDYRPE